MPDDKQNAVQLRFIQKEGNRFEIEFRAPREYVAFVKESIESELDQMPITTQQVFQSLLDQLEKKSENQE